MKIVERFLEGVIEQIIEALEQTYEKMLEVPIDIVPEKYFVHIHPVLAYMLKFNDGEEITKYSLTVVLDEDQPEDNMSITA
jgi:hypothetical protein